MKFIPSILLVCMVALPAASQESKENADFKLAVNLYNDKLYDLSLEQFRQFVNSYPNTQQGIEARFYLGLTQTKLGKFDDARFTFQNFALSYPDNPKAPEAWTNVAESYVALKNYREAALAYERVKTFHPKSKLAAPSLSKAAENFERVGDKDGVKRMLKVLVQEYSTPDVLPARLRLAELYSEENEFDAARTECKRVLDAAKDDSLKARAMLLHATVHVKQNRLADAEAVLQDLMKNFRSTSSYHGTLLLLGDVRKALGNTTDALSVWRVGADDSAKCPKAVRQQALLAIGQLYVEDRDWKNALKSFERAGGIAAERTGEAWFRSAQAAEAQNDLRRASEYYQRAYRDTLNAVDRRSLTIGAFKAALFDKDHNEAVRLGAAFEQAYPTDPLLPRVLMETGRLYRDVMRDFRSAERNFEASITRFPASNTVDDALFELSSTLRQAGNYAAAVEEFENLKRRFPSSPLTDDADGQIFRIRSFDQKDRDAGLQNLALLVGDVIAQKSKADLAFRLAEIYFYQFKDYTQAAVQYESALAGGLEDRERPAAMFGLARSFEFSALLEEDKKHDPSRARSRAIASYDSLLRRYPSFEKSDDAIVALFGLKLKVETNPTQIRKMSSEFLGSYPAARRKDLVLLAIANALMSSKSFEDAALTFKLVKEKTVQPEIAAEAQFRFGACLLNMGNKDSARVVLTQFLVDSPNTPFSAQAASMLAQLAAERGDEQTALGFLSQLEKQYFYTAFADGLSLRRGEAAFNAKNYSGAIDAFQKAIREQISDVFSIREVARDVLFKLAFSYRNIGKRAEAKRFYAAYLSRSGSSDRAGEAYLALASIAKEEKNFDLAAKYLQEALRFQKETGDQGASVAVEAAELFYRNEQYTEAIPRFSEAVQRTTDTTQLHYLVSRVAVCFFRLDNTSEADKRVESFVKSYPKATNYVAEFDFERGKYFLRKDDLHKAKAAFDSVRKHYPKAPIIPEVLYWTARTLELDQHPQEAIGVYDSLLSAFSQSAVAPRAQLSRGNAYYGLERWDAAAKDFKALLDSEQRAPDLVQYAMNNLILTYKELSLFDGALELTRKYIERYPTDPELIGKRIDIGVLYQKLGYYDQSILHLQGLLENGNADLEAELRYYIGEAYFYKGEYQQAILEFLKVPYLVTKRGKIDWISTAYYMAGQSYEKMSKYDQAMTMYKQIIDRKDTDAQFKTAAQKEIDRVRTVVGK
ncbi:MAG: tetratricopeptide repeat protein [Ignavibacteriales bacterium]|nr:tetratricopeptide repeat protein [Ignavibacteriales bacterium]